MTADGAAYFGHWWNYVKTFGPALHTSKGQLAFLFPAIPFAIYGAITLSIVACVDDHGRRPFERLTRLAPKGAGLTYEARRALTWAVAMNVCYGLFLTIPMVLIRLAFLGDSTLVP